MAITWSIVQLDYALSEDGHTDVVNNSHWQCIDEDASGNQARVYGSVAIPTDDLSNFTPYADITEAEALQWTFFVHRNRSSQEGTQILKLRSTPALSR